MFNVKKNTNSLSILFYHLWSSAALFGPFKTPWRGADLPPKLFPEILERVSKVSKSFLLRWHRQIQNSFGYMDKILHNGRCLLPNWHIGHHVNLTCYRLWSSIATAKQVLHEWEKWVGRPHWHPPPKTGSGGLVWTSKLTRHPLPNPDLPAPQLPTPQHQTRMELQDAGAQSRPFGPKNVL